MTETIYFSPKIGSMIFWTFLFITIIGNLIISVVLVPIMLVMNEIYLYSSIAFIAFSFGFLLNSIVKSIEKIDKQKHLIAGILMPAIALINVIIFTYLSNDLIKLMHLETQMHSPLTIGVTYVFAFTLPYMITEYVRVKKRK